MSGLARVSPRKVLVVASLWPLGWIALIAVQIMFDVWQARHGSNVAAIGFGVSSWWLFTAFLLAPPALLLVAWAMARRRGSASKTTAATPWQS